MRLSAENLVVSRGDRVVIDAISFDAASGEALLLTGPNGSGKTTLLRAVAGLIPAKSGVLRLDGGDGERDIAEQCHYVGHLNGIKTGLTARENLRFWARYLDPSVTSAAAAHRVDAALARFELDPLGAVQSGLLSAGQKRRLGLARLLVAERPIWLLDEPTVSLDTASTAILTGVIGAHLAGCGIVLAATHLPLGLDGAKFLKLGERRELAA